jgi:hypothetical protein
MNMDYVFNVSEFEPRQGGAGNHPIGRFPATITDTSIVENKDKTGGMFVVEFTTPNGTIVIRYNLWNQSEQAKQIAQGQLAALGHAVSIYQIDMRNGGQSLRGAQLMIEVGFQKGQEPTSERPNGGFTEVKKVLDKNGNEPGKGGNNTAAQSQSQPSVGQNWGGSAQPQQQATQGQQGQGWTAPQPQQATDQTPQQPSQLDASNSWQQQSGPAGASPPWSKR